MELTHFDEQGNVVMVDVSQKVNTVREATATGKISMSTDCFKAVTDKSVKKGDVLSVARVAGIMAVKNTSSIIPLCHPLHIEKSIIDFEMDASQDEILAFCTVKISGKTGVEMEALTGATVALLTIYDMCKAIDKDMVISEVCLLEKLGGKSGNYQKKAR